MSLYPVCATCAGLAAISSALVTCPSPAQVSQFKCAACPRSPALPPSRARRRPAARPRRRPSAAGTCPPAGPAAHPALRPSHRILRLAMLVAQRHARSSQRGVILAQQPPLAVPPFADSHVRDDELGAVLRAGAHAYSLPVKQHQPGRAGGGARQPQAVGRVEVAVHQRPAAWARGEPVPRLSWIMDRQRARPKRTRCPPSGALRHVRR